MPNFVEIAPRYGDFSISQDGGRRHVEVSWEQRTEASKFTKMGTWGG